MPDMLLRLMQVQIHFEHQKLNMYENDEQSIGLFMSFHQKPSSLLVPPPAQANLNPALSKALYDAAWAFGHSFKTDGFDWGPFAKGALTITRRLGPHIESEHPSSTWLTSYCEKTVSHRCPSKTLSVFELRHQACAQVMNSKS